jgi:hypothetical protein
MTQTTFVFTTDYKNEFKRYVDELFTRVKYDEKTGGELAFKRVDRLPQAGDYVILRGDSTPVKYDEKTHFESEITTVLVPDRTKRIAIIDELIESYIAATGQRPDSVQLDRLATLCLREELTDRHPDKMSREEFPIMSDDQLARREEDERLLAEVIYGRDKVIGYRRTWYEGDDGTIQSTRQKLFDYMTKNN